MEFLDEQGVQPCGHKAREKCVLIKVFASCLPSEIPTEYQLSTKGIHSDKNTGDAYLRISHPQLDTQHTYYVDSSELHCKGETIGNPCTLQDGFTWQKWKQSKRIQLEKGTRSGNPHWKYVQVVDDDETVIKVLSGTFQASDHGRILESGTGKDPPNEVKDRIERQYGPVYN